MDDGFAILFQKRLAATPTPFFFISRSVTLTGLGLGRESGTGSTCIAEDVTFTRTSAL